MGRIKKGDLIYKDYSWKALKDNPKKKGKNERAQLNRKQGYEVLYFANKFLEKYDLTEPTSSAKIERMLRNDIPGTIKDRKKIEAWIVKNWG